jgi:hypothetical protein
MIYIYNSGKIEIVNNITNEVSTTTFDELTGGGSKCRDI